MADKKAKKKGFGALIWILIGLGVITLILFVVFFVLGLLFSLGVINNGLPISQAKCTATPGFVCDSLIMKTNSNTSFSIGNGYGNLYNMQFACASKQTANGGAPSYAIFNGSNPVLNMKNDTFIGITDLPCYGDNGKINNLTIGTSFSGFIWINYTNSVAVPSSSNPWHTVRYATFSANVI